MRYPKMELSLDLSLAYVPTSVSGLLGDVSCSKDGSQKMAMIEDFMKRLEDEMRKIEAFKRELPLCMLLVKDALSRLKEETDQCMRRQDKPVVEEFGPLKTDSGGKGSLIMGKESCDKKNWMNSAQLWSAETKSRSEEDDRSVPEKPSQPQNEKNNSRGPFLAFNYGNSGVSKEVMKDDKEFSQVPSLSLMTPAFEPSHGNSKSGCGGNFGSSLLASPVEITGHPSQPHQNPRKQRRCWSPELHRRFVDALQQLGGPQVATPKQIRELMQVGGLTNDEVKSHLQKYRIHVRRLPVSSIGQDNKDLWMAQDQSGDKSKGSLSQSGSPQGPLFLGGSAKGLSSSGRNLIDAEEDEQSDCCSRKGGLHQQPEADVL